MLGPASMSDPSQTESVDDMLVFFVLSPVESDACVERVNHGLFMMSNSGYRTLHKWGRFCVVRSQRFEPGVLDLSTVGMHVFSYTEIERHLWKTGSNIPQQAFSPTCAFPPIVLRGCISTKNQVFAGIVLQSGGQ